MFRVFPADGVFCTHTDGTIELGQHLSALAISLYDQQSLQLGLKSGIKWLKVDNDGVFRSQGPGPLNALLSENTGYI